MKIRSGLVGGALSLAFLGCSASQPSTAPAPSQDVQAKATTASEDERTWLASASTSERPRLRWKEESSAVHSTRVGGASLRVTVKGEFTLKSDAFLPWIGRCALIIHRLYGEDFPVSTLDVELAPGRGSGITFGQAFEGQKIRIYIGDPVTESDLRNDWVLIHEMLHLGFPYLAEKHGWMREGLSTYLEPILRVRSGLLEQDEMWIRFSKKMELGIPVDGDRGLDRTPSWANTYWGGALFWWGIDVELRAATNGEQSVDTLLRGLVQSGGNARSTWDIIDVCKRSREITGQSIFCRAYERASVTPLHYRPDEIFAALGVLVEGDAVRYDERAPQASVRTQMLRWPE